jgi:hypothetical protein
MPDVLAPLDAFNFAKTMVKGMPLDDIQVRLLDDASKFLWMAAPWRWTLGLISPPVTIANGVQDYTVTLPADFLYLEQALFVDGDRLQDLPVVTILPATSVVPGRPSCVSLLPGTSTLRLFPAPADYNASNLPSILLVYKKKQTPVTAGNVSTAGASGVPDEWFPVYELFVLAGAYQYADDPRAGAAQVQIGQGQAAASYNGAWGTAMAALVTMKLAEKPFLSGAGEPQGQG